MLLFRTGRTAACLAMSMVVALSAGSAQGRVFGIGSKPVPTLSPSQLADIQRALDEQRLMDAGQLIDQAATAGMKDPQLRIMAGELGLLRGRLEAAIGDFKAVEAAPATAGASLQGQGIALVRMGRTNEAIAVLQRAVATSPDAWRAWNALGSIYDQRRDWAHAAEAYDHALAASNGSPMVLNNRGYSKLLQGKLTESVPDFVAALDKKPDLVEARTNLRLAMALKGDYTRSLAGGGQDDRAALLNNAGFAAGVRGDYAKAEDFLEQALKARGEYYDRASENLKVIHDLEAQAKAGQNEHK